MKTFSNPLARVVLAASLMFAAPQLFADDCHWWQFGHCKDEKQIEGLPEDAPKEGTVITIDVATNHAYLFQDGELVSKSAAATGSGKVLKKAGKTWLFHTPRGKMKVLRKLEDPVWRKPDWAFVEAGESVPAPDSPKRLVKGKLGKYALDLGDGILIHGTDDPNSIGKKVSHGCIRLPDGMLEKVYSAAKVGTDVYIFESQSRDEEVMASKGRNDLDERGSQ
ncbi:MAG TPA: L,D-transpeptidase [Thermoanaerobaculia bacterium]|nr:L,D-transpeptidase [Thermoanaerobaculia bacterium]